MTRTGPEPGPGLVAVDELGTVLGVETRVIVEYVELGLVSPTADTGVPSLTIADVARLSRALRLARELELHAAAATVVVELIDERDALRRRLACLERLAGGPA